MYSLLIVDDEVFIANKIKSSVHWEQIGISQVFVAHNIRQAKELYENHTIDVMICDIEMPQGNGIELLEWVRQRRLKIESIFLTCHTDFEFTKKAIQLGSLDYLLKPVQQDELRATVLKAINKIHMERPLIVERFWLELLDQTIPSNLEKIKEIIDQRNIPYSDKMRFLPILIGVQHWKKELSIREENIMEYALRKTAEELVIPTGEGQIIPVKKGYLLVIIPYNSPACKDSNKLKENLQSYIEACNRYFYCQLSCYIGTEVFVQDMLRMFEGLADLHQNHVSHSMQVVSYREKSIKDRAVPLPQMNVWSEMLKRGDKHKLLAEIMDSLESWKQIEGLDANKLQRYYQRFLQMLLFTLQQKGITVDEGISNHLSPERTLTATRSVLNLQLWVKELLDTVFHYMLREDSSQTIVDKIKRYITLHIDQALSRQYIADHVGLSPDYVVKLFKKETGLSISGYIVRERIRMSKELLTKSDLPISNIALAVGYTNFAYFSTTFKKEVSMTPQDYRKKYQQ